MNPPKDYAIPRGERRPHITTIERAFLAGIAIGFVVGGIAGIALTVI